MADTDEPKPAPQDPKDATPPPEQTAPAAAPADSIAETALKAAQEAVADMGAMAAQAAAGGTPGDAAKVGATPFDLPGFAGASGGSSQRAIDLLSDVNLNVKIELGRTRMLVEDVLRLGEGAVVELDKLAGDPVDVFVNDRLVARGEVLVLNDNFCVRINEILSPQGESEKKTAAGAA